jgi:Cell division protein FtsI/penicillin-binding protein 2
LKYRKALIAIVVVIAAVLAGCSRSQKPEDAFNAYISSWQKKDFKTMYSILSKDSQGSITEQEFINRHQNIYDGIVLTDISIKPDYPKDLKADKNGEVHISFNVKMTTGAGPVEFTNNAVLVKEKKDKSDIWGIKWSVGMIFPQMVQGDKVVFTPNNAKRGEITDRNGNKLAANGYASSVGIVPGKLSADKNASKAQIAKILGISTESIDKALGASWVADDKFVPITTLSKDDPRVDSLLKVPGIKVIDKAVRVYPYGESAAHLTGYIGSITAEELKQHKTDGYSESDLIGKAGLEYTFEKRLRGENGGEIDIVDSNGKKKLAVVKKDPVNGEDIKLTIDASVQDAVYKEFNGDAGSAAAVNPKTGEVLALVSSPSYNPNLFILGLSDSQWAALRDDPKKPMSNRFASVYAPGSVFKTITAAIGLKTGALNPDEKVNIQGKQWQKDGSWGGHYVTRITDPGRPVNLRDALVMSDNIYLAQAALKIGKEKMASEVKNFGIGEQIPFAFIIKNSQISGDGSVKSDVLLADSGYGQGEVMMSTLHMSLIYSLFANGGNIPAPRLEVKEEAKNWHEGVVPQNVIDIIKGDLLQVVSASDGTAKELRIAGMNIAAKTGTAELKSDKNDTNATENGWIVAYNADNPKMVIAMMVEDVKNRNGSHYVAPKVKDVLNRFK